MYAGNEHDAAAVFHQFGALLRAQKVACYICGDNLVPAFQTGVEHIAVNGQIGRVAYKHIQVVKGIPYLFKAAVNGLGFPLVHAKGQKTVFGEFFL